MPVTKIVVIGDSLTTQSCWRAALWQTMNEKVAGRFDFVGSHASDFGCAPSGYDQDSEASDGSLLSDADAKLSELAAAMMIYKPDVALVHYGTDDVRNGVATNDIVDVHTRLVHSLRAANPDVTILVAKLSPVNVTSKTCSGCTCDACAMGIFDLNQVLGGAWWRAGGVTMVDQVFPFDVDADTRDGVYPNDSGSAKIAANWAKALARLPQFAFWFR